MVILIIKKGEGRKRKGKFIIGSGSKKGLFGARIKHVETRCGCGSESSIIRGIALLLPCSVADTIILKPKDEITENRFNEYLVTYFYGVRTDFPGTIRHTITIPQSPSDQEVGDVSGRVHRRDRHQKGESH